MTRPQSLVWSGTEVAQGCLVSSEGGWSWGNPDAPPQSLAGLDSRVCDRQHRGTGVWSRSLGFHSTGAFLKGSVGNAASAFE